MSWPHKFDFNSFIFALRQWFEKNKVEHYFRQNRTPYRVWVSEVALQQTRIQAALEPLKNFFNHFASLKQLAAASEEQVLAAFKGLGYYNRARNLRKGALYIEKHHGGKMPQEYKALLEVPSIGPYTAAAISSICFGKRNAVLDGNVKRILSRVLPIEDEISEKQFEITAQSFLTEMMRQCHDHPGDLNEAIMQLGQQICTKANPNCMLCPLQTLCQAKAQQRQNSLPRKKVKARAEEVTWQMLVYKQKNRYALHRPENFHFLAGHFIFPSRLVFNSKSVFTSMPLEGLFEKATALGQFKHTITRYRISVELFSTEIAPAGQLTYFTAEQLEKVLISSLMTKAVTYAHTAPSFEKR